MVWSPIDLPIDFAILAGMPTPGIADVTGASSPRKWDKRMGYGWSGAFPIFRGHDLSEFDLKIRLYTQQHWEDWEIFRPIVAKLPDGKRPRAFDIYHPFLDALAIRSVVVLDVTQPEPIEDGTVYEVKIPLLTFRRPKITLVKPEGSKATTTDPIDKLIESMTAQVEQLAAG